MSLLLRFPGRVPGSVSLNPLLPPASRGVRVAQLGLLPAAGATTIGGSVGGLQSSVHWGPPWLVRCSGGRGDVSPSLAPCVLILKYSWPIVTIPAGMNKSS